MFSATLIPLIFMRLLIFMQQKYESIKNALIYGHVLLKAHLQ